MKVSQTLLCVLLLRGSCLLPPETAAAAESVLDTTVVYHLDYDYTEYYDDSLTEIESVLDSETESTTILPTEQPEPPDVLFYLRLVLVCTIAVLFIVPTVCFTFLWKERVSSAGRSSGEYYVC
ncbi:hypothetical protein OJAV_G00070870 [Oryzias javanicus]|uniref:Uncharacterized protein n=1 Tax=Oryzias javanicus TaxID=123683 RepID=A0A437D785_ORYJA|nr:hypothetical protein OJAV_G00070870 [Oryzias javanicus]